MNRIVKRRWQDMATLGFGFWLIISPFILPRTTGDYVLFNNSLIIGILLSVVALATLSRPNAWKEWAVVALASWLIAASYFFGNGGVLNGTNTILSWNQLIVGLLVMADAAIGLYRRQAIRDMDEAGA